MQPIVTDTPIMQESQIEYQFVYIRDFKLSLYKNYLILKV